MSLFLFTIPKRQVYHPNYGNVKLSLKHLIYKNSQKKGSSTDLYKVTKGKANTLNYVLNNANIRTSEN